MGTVHKDSIDIFYGGISQDIRIQRPEVFEAASHFDIFTNPKRLTPYRAMEANEDLTYTILNFVLGRGNGKMYALGSQVGGSKAKVYEKALDNIADGWSASTNGEDASGAKDYRTFLDFHNYLYGLTAGARIWAWGDYTGSPTFTSTALSVGSFSNTCKGIITTDDLLLQPYNNKIARKNGAGSGPTDQWTAAALTLPSLYAISDLCELGDLVAIACRPLTDGLSSKVFLWDKVSDDPLDVIDFGEGALMILDELEGELIGVSQEGGLLVATGALKPKITIRRWSSGSKARVAFELEGENTNTAVSNNASKVKDGNKILFGVQITIGGVAYFQLGAVGRKAEGYPIAFTFDRKIDNDTAITNLYSAYKYGGYIFSAFNNDGSVNRTNDDSSAYTATSTYISQKINGGSKDPDAVRKQKKLTYAGLRCAPLGSGDSLKLYYRIDAESSWTEIKTYTTASGLGFEAGVQADGADFRNFYEMQFKVESTGGAEPTAIEFGFEVLDAPASE